MKEQILMDAAGLENVDEGPPRVNAKKTRIKFSAISIPAKILEEIDELIEELGYWPSRSAFVREACLEKIKHEKERLKEQKRKPQTKK
ncbi:MAG: ribbon-helix-helix protein, CopG family [Candidatus Bathyarchaeia archaeon]